MDLAVLIPAILSYVRDESGFATRTKLLKMLYLLDLEAYRETHQTLTGFSWRFHLYGPWAPEYQDALNSLEKAGKITLRPGTRADLDTVFVDATERIPLDKAFPAIKTELKARRIIEAWADRPTGEILDYVYFHTAPMAGAKRDNPLDFDLVFSDEPRPDYLRSEGKLGDKVLEKKRNDLREALKAARRQRRSGPLDPAPRYDDEFWNAIETLDRDPD
jgi:hypothetical protein